LENNAYDQQKTGSASIDKAIKNTEKIKEWQDHMIPID